MEGMPLRRTPGIRMLVVVATFVSCSMLLLARNGAVSPAGCKALNSVFSGFTLVSQSSCEGPGYMAHDMTGLAQPKSFQSGICYEYVLSTQFSDIPHEALEKRLRATGATVIHSPTLNHDLVHLMIGGPLFHIDFRRAHTEGVIQAVQDTMIARDSSLRITWNATAFVLYIRP